MTSQSSAAAHTDELAGALGRDDDGAALGPRRDVVTAEQVWAALAEIPDPEIPVDLARRPRRRARRRVDGDRVHVEFTPTFLGCPALEVMRDAMAEAIEALGGEPEVEVVARRLVVDRPDHPGGPREAPRGRLRPAGPARGRRAAARPAPERRRSAARTAARPRHGLDNLFGPTPCRSIRYCESCRQPFEQFKTI